MSSVIFAVYLGNLRQDIGKVTLEQNILDLFQNYLFIELPNNNVELIHNGTDNCWCALVKLQSEYDMNEASNKLCSRENRTKLGYKFLRLVEPYVLLFVKTITEKVYLFNQRLGNETRDKEFKAGGGNYVKKYLKGDIKKYLTAFLNSHENGTLFIGVKDDGFVEGIELSQKQIDQQTLKIDEAVKSIKPKVLPEMYKVNFITVLGNGDSRKVIEITVFGKDFVHDTLYSTEDGVFVRRDGSVEKVEAFEIMEWAKQKFKKEQKMEDIEEKMNEISQDILKTQKEEI